MGFQLLTDFVMYFVGDLKEVFVDPARDESLIVELLDLKHDVADNGSATWFLQDLASEQDAEGAMVTNQHPHSFLFHFSFFKSGMYPDRFSIASRISISKI